MATRWGLVDASRVAAADAAPALRREAEPRAEPRVEEREAAWAELDPAAVINRALRAAGLVR
jgi:hypothetical protein